MIFTIRRFRALKAPRGPKMAPRRPQIALGRPQDGLRLPQEGPKRASGKLKRAPEGPKRAPSWPQEGSKRGSKRAPREKPEPTWLGDPSRAARGPLWDPSGTLPGPFQSHILEPMRGTFCLFLLAPRLPPTDPKMASFWSRIIFFTGMGGRSNSYPRVHIYY